MGVGYRHTRQRAESGEFISLPAAVGIHGSRNCSSSFCCPACRGLLFPSSLRNSEWVGAVAGASAAGAVIVFELRVRALSLRRLIGAVAGSVLGIFGAALFCLVLRSAPLNNINSAVLQIFVLLLMTYVGLLVGASNPTYEIGRAHV